MGRWKPFVKNFSEYLTKQGVTVVHDLYDQDIDVIILMDPRKAHILQPLHIKI